MVKYLCSRMEIDLFRTPCKMNYDKNGTNILKIQKCIFLVKTNY